MRVVWLCHFSNAEIERRLGIRKVANGFAPWIPNTIRELDGCEGIDLYVVSPHRKLLWIKEYIDDNVHYIFFPIGFPWGNGILRRVIPLYPRVMHEVHKWFSRRIINRINPDIIHLHGAENDYYSSLIFQFRGRYPILITIQGFISHTSQKEFKAYKKRIQTELHILQSFKHFGIRTKTMGEDVKKVNPHAVLHWHWYSIPPIDPIRVPKEYDVVHFARLCKDKGIEDFLLALRMVKETIPTVTAVIIGNAKKDYKDYLHTLAVNYGIDKNIIQWIDYLIPDELHKKVAQARVKVLPTYGGDIITGAILESMLLEVPVIAYESGSVVEVNLEGENILGIATGNVKGIADGILRLLNDDKYRIALGKRGRAYALNIHCNTDIKGDLARCYGETIQAYLQDHVG